MSAVFEQIFQVGFLAAIIRIATPLAFATLGEMFSERAGVLNLGIEGIMLLSAMAGFTATSLSGSLWLGVLVAVLTGALMGAVHALFTVALGLSQHVCGIGVTLFCSGLAYFLYRLIFGQQSVPPSIKGFQPVPIPVLSEIPVLGPAVFNQFALVYMAILAIPTGLLVLAGLLALFIKARSASTPDRRLQYDEDEDLDQGSEKQEEDRGRRSKKAR